MKRFIFVFAILTMFSIASFAQSSSDYKSGNFSVPSYKENGWVDMNKDGLDGQCMYYFNDGKSGTLWYSKKCGKYYVKEVGVKVHYPSKEMGIKALYAKKKDGCDMKGSVNCY